MMRDPKDAKTLRNSPVSEAEKAWQKMEISREVERLARMYRDEPAFMAAIGNELQRQFAPEPQPDPRTYREDELNHLLEERNALKRKMEKFDAFS